MSFDSPRAPIVIDHVLPNPSLVRELLIRGAPYWTVQRYVKNRSEMAALSDAAKQGRKNRPTDTLHDRAFVEVLNATYRRAPTVW